MKNKNDIFNITVTDGVTCKLADIRTSGKISVYDIELDWNDAAYDDNGCVTFEWYVPMIGFMYRWSPLCGSERSILPNWCGRRRSMLASNAPTETIYDGSGNNRYTFAVSECKKSVYFGSGVVEENGCVHFIVRIAVKQFTAKRHTAFSIYIDTRDIPMNEAIAGVAKWWETECGMRPAEVPDAALEPVYSFWYSYHQDLTADEIERECARAKELGFDVCIVDDGWQTEDLSRGYAYCGEWLPAKSKMGNMAEHVARVHALGMKYVLWFSVPYMGNLSANYAEFKDMMLRHDEGQRTAVLDPRYKKVREYLKGVYIRALNEWKLDGFKLDFIDQWSENPQNTPYNEKMDIPDLQDAVDAFMMDTVTSLKAIKPDILLEFRQVYIGPNMRKYGNMFRVADCPNDYVKNRIGVFDLRMHLAGSAVHSDMLMWHRDETPERAAIQIINVLFGVLQYSARLDTLSDEMKKMSRFYLNFMNEHRKTLLKSDMRAFEGELNYTWAKASSDDECIVAVYSIDKCVLPDDKKRIYIVNGCEGERVLVDLNGDYLISVKNCMGETVLTCDKTLNGVETISVPMSGIVLLERRV